VKIVKNAKEIAIAKILYVMINAVAAIA